MAEQPDQNRSEDATPFKLRRARERGQVARSTEPAFLAAMVALAAFALASADRIAAGLAVLVRAIIVGGIAAAAGSGPAAIGLPGGGWPDRKSTRLNSSH